MNSEYRVFPDKIESTKRSEIKDGKLTNEAGPLVLIYDGITRGIAGLSVWSDVIAIWI